MTRDELREKVRECLNDGMSQSEAGRVYGISKAAVARLRKGMMLPPRELEPVVNPRLLLRLHQNGYRWSEIATIFGVPVKLIYQVAFSIGIDRRTSEGSSLMPIPAGHPRSWRLINAGIPSLENQPFRIGL